MDWKYISSRSLWIGQKSQWSPTSWWGVVQRCRPIAIIHGSSSKKGVAEPLDRKDFMKKVTEQADKELDRCSENSVEEAKLMILSGFFTVSTYYYRWLHLAVNVSWPNEPVAGIVVSFTILLLQFGNERDVWARSLISVFVLYAIFASTKCVFVAQQSVLFLWDML